MPRNNLWLISLLIFVISLGATAIATGASPEAVVFVQSGPEQQTLYLSDSSGAAPRSLASAPDLSVFVQGKHMLYFSQRQLYRFDPVAQQFNPLVKLQEDQVKLQILNSAPDQALLVARDGYELHWYILELSDGSIRRISQPGSSASQSKMELLSPDQSGVATLKRSPGGSRLELTVKSKATADRPLLNWALPRKMNALPQAPVWSPDSRWLAFYAQEQGNQEGYFSLYLLDLNTRQLITAQERVFAKFFIEELPLEGFKPDWSADSKYLAFQYQSYAAPTSSLIMKYEVATGQKTALVKGTGRQQYPIWSPTGKHLVFLSDREGGTNQLYLTTDQGEGLRRLSPPSGQTIWALWYQP